MYYKQKLILDYFLCHGWKLNRVGKLFIYLQPAKPQKFPPNYLLEIPLTDNSRALNIYMDRLLAELKDELLIENSLDDLQVLFSNENSILKYRIFDSENKDGKISLRKHIDSLDSFQKILSQAVIFVTTNKAIFANAKIEVESYMNLCRAMQTEKGSFVSKFEIPNQKIPSAYSSFDSSAVNKKFFDVLEFVKREIIKPRTAPTIDEKYISEHSEFINYELLRSIKDIYSKTDINNIEYQLFSSNSTRIVRTERVQNRIRYFNTYLHDLKQILLESVDLEITGKIKRLSSNSPLTSNNNSVFITTEISNVEENVKVTLRSDDYAAALEAHRTERLVRVRGKARQNKNSLSIPVCDSFAVI